MILHDFRCRGCGLTEERMCLSTDSWLRCTQCGAAADRKILSAAKPHWSALAMGENASPEAVSRFDRVHRQQKAKEEKCYAEHGDYGPLPGAD